MSEVTRAEERQPTYAEFALEQVRRQLPVSTRFLPYGHKLGFGMIGRAALNVQRAPATARLAAHDVVRYDQQGCYSPHVFYVERGGKVTPREFAQYLASELANLEKRFPRRMLGLEPCRWLPVRRRRRALGCGLRGRAARPCSDGCESRHPGGGGGPPR